MRRDWDDRARKNAFFYIASWRENWEAADFFQSGEEDYDRFVAPVLAANGVTPSGKSMLELGCGAGRMTRSFAGRFDGVIAHDVSSEMLTKAGELLKDLSNVTWVHANGMNLRPTPDSSVDFVFSYLVLQHLPEESLIRTYIQEMIRVLRPSGICLFQFNGSSAPSMNWRGRLAWGVINAIWKLRLRSLARGLAKSLGFDPEMSGKSWHGPAVKGAWISEATKSSGAEVIEIKGDGTPIAWCVARKSTVPAGDSFRS
jgi:SAM-dependent methyltransferase